MTIHSDIVVAGGHGGGFQATAGRFVTIVDLEGTQTCDLVVLTVNGTGEHLSTSHCREALASLFVRSGDRLVTDRRRPILEIVADTVGVHDLTIAACDDTRYSVEFGISGHRNCLRNLQEGLGGDRPWWSVPEPLNLFQNTPVVEGGYVGIAAGTSRPGDRITFLALMDVVGAVSSCPQDIIPSNGFRPSPLRVIVADAPVMEG